MSAPRAPLRRPAGGAALRREPTHADRHPKENNMAIVEVKVPQLSESVAEATLLQWKKKPGEAVDDRRDPDRDRDRQGRARGAGAGRRRAGADRQERRRQLHRRGSDREDRHRRQGAAPAAIAVERAAGRSPRRARRPACRAARPRAGRPRASVAMPAAAKLMAEQRPAGRLGRRHRQGRPRHQGRRARRAGRRRQAGRAGAAPAPPPPRQRRAAAAPASAAAVPAPTRRLGDRPEQRVPMSRLRARVAERLLQSQSTNAILTTFNEVNMAPVMEMRKQFQEKFEKEHGVKLGFMSFFVKAAVAALKKYPIDQRLGRRQRHRLPRLLRHRHRGRLAARPGRADPAQRRPDELRRHREEDRRVRPEGAGTASCRSTI